MERHACPAPLFHRLHAALVQSGYHRRRIASYRLWQKQKLESIIAEMGAMNQYIKAMPLGVPCLSCHTVWTADLASILVRWVFRFKRLIDPMNGAIWNPKASDSSKPRTSRRTSIHWYNRHFKNLSCCLCIALKNSISTMFYGECDGVRAHETLRAYALSSGELRISIATFCLRMNGSAASTGSGCFIRNKAARASHGGSLPAPHMDIAFICLCEKILFRSTLVRIYSPHSRFQRWSRKFGPGVKVDRIAKETILNGKEKDAYA
jgi:hypothetical protein